MELAPQRMKLGYLYINNFKADTKVIDLKFLLEEECRCLFLYNKNTDPVKKFI